jgi:hypothetical protein
LQIQFRSRLSSPAGTGAAGQAAAERIGADSIPELTEPQISPEYAASLPPQKPFAVGALS